MKTPSILLGSLVLVFASISGLFAAEDSHTSGSGTLSNRSNAGRTHNSGNQTLNSRSGGALNSESRTGNGNGPALNSRNDSRGGKLLNSETGAANNNGIGLNSRGGGLLNSETGSGNTNGPSLNSGKGGRLNRTLNSESGAGNSNGTRNNPDTNNNSSGAGPRQGSNRDARSANDNVGQSRNSGRDPNKNQGEKKEQEDTEARNSDAKNSDPDEPPPDNNNGGGTKAADENGEARGGSNVNFGRSDNVERRGKLESNAGGAILNAGASNDPTGRYRDQEKRDKEADAAAAKEALTRANVLTGNAGKLPTSNGVSPELKKAVELAKERKKAGQAGSGNQ